MAARQESMQVQGAQAGGSPAFGYRLLYALGAAFWDKGYVPPELVAMVEGPQRLAPGRALDLGCGTGTQAVYLAQHGWQVAGVDYVPRALARAEVRAAASGPDVRAAARFVQGDVTKLPALGLGDGYTLLLDFGCLHGLGAGQRTLYAGGVSSLAAPGATLLLMGFAPGFRGPAPHGIDRDEVERLFGARWELIWDRPAQGMPLPPMLRSARPAWYCLRRRVGA